MLCRIQPSLMALKFYTYCQHARIFFSCMQTFCERAPRVEISLRQQAKNIKSFLNLRTYHDVVVNFSSYTAILQSRRNADRGGFSTSLKIEPEPFTSKV